ncbi:cytochrome c biogenesis protein ResB [Mobilicoccus caccae]|uniref:ResB-like domain-containing protein n=1 Tax=Mobilicoccus caccae TaxID=1859295 RepID=A0ABQ6IYE2_9MICO|nr:cytochrome c biogenesis protein ResB [Mobilicoccus caccae]GMA42315.1 hypothetical protein GCM10025883_43600 [Mobilicoccus caccae]
MTDTTIRETTGGPAGEEPPQRPNDPPVRRRREDTPVEAFFHRGFALFHNKKFGLFLILAMTVFTLIGVLLPQVAQDVRNDPQSYAEWLAGMRPRFGGWTPIFEALGFFSMFTSLWFKIVTVLLALSIIACTLHRMPLLWQNATRPHLHVTDGFFEHAKVHEVVEVSHSPQEAVVDLRRILARRRFRVLDDPKGTASASTPTASGGCRSAPCWPTPRSSSCSSA